MLCSTIIPTINRPSLERAVKSALAQNLDPAQHEIIVVNDSGQSLPDVEWLKPPQISIINTNRCERSVACNTGAAVAKGKYLKILHDDDYLLPGALRALIDVAESTGCMWAYGAFARADDNDVFMSLQMPEVSGNVFAHCIAGDSFHLSSSLIRRDAFFQVGAFNSLNTAEDIDLQWRIARIGETNYTDHEVARIRVGASGNTSTNWSRMTQDCRRVREMAMNSPNAFHNTRDSIKDNLLLRGRCTRAYLISALLNLRVGHFSTAVYRTLFTMLLAVPGIWHAQFWQGLLMRSHWHVNEKEREEAHYARHFPEKFKPQTW